VRHEIEGSGLSLPQAAIRFALAHPAVSTVIPGIRSVAQAEANCAVSDSLPLSEDLLLRLRKHAWRHAFWYGGK
jgi:aryl-alcohol dehydrogenase-like predicted oxidoreductase